jgi:hypothetical protein
MSQTVIYNVHADPATGLPYFSSTPPTTVQAAQVQELAVLVNLALADTQALITHNFQLNATQYQSFYEPMIVGPVWLNGPLGGGTQAPLITFGLGANTITANKLGVAGTEGTFILYLRKAQSPYR